MYDEKIKELQSYFKTHNKYKEYLAHSSKVHSVGWSCDGRRLASGSFDKTVCIYTLDKDKLVYFSVGVHLRVAYNDLSL